MDWFGKAKIDFYHSPEPVALKQKDGSPIDLLKICEDTVPPCNLNPLLFNGHLQTCWTATKPHGPQIWYKRKVFDADHETFKGNFAVDFVVEQFEQPDSSLPPRTKNFTNDELTTIASDDSRPMLVILHGLSGGSHEVYLRHAIAPLVLNDGGFEACVVNSRGCARSKITSGILYNARATWDLRQTVKWLRKTFPNRPLFGLGFSLGANMMTNYCGEEGPRCQLKAAMVCANPWNLELSSELLKTTLLGRGYQRVLGTSMKGLIKNNEEEIIKYTKLNLDAIRNITYLWEFDREVQCVTWGYPTENAYYRDAASVDSVMAIRIPFLAINATDDPIALQQTLPRSEVKQNPYTVLCTTSLGGHLAWFEAGGGRWHSRPVSNFFNYMAHKVDLSTIGPDAAGSAISEGKEAQSVFDPMRRKMAVSMS